MSKQEKKRRKKKTAPYLEKDEDSRYFFKNREERERERKINFDLLAKTRTDFAVKLVILLSVPCSFFCFVVAY